MQKLTKPRKKQQKKNLHIKSSTRQLTTIKSNIKPNIYSKSLLLQQKRHYSNKSPLEVYDDGVNQGILREDPRQRGTIVELDGLYTRLTRLPGNYIQRIRDVQVHIDQPTKSTTELMSAFFSKLMKKGNNNQTTTTHSNNEHGTAHAIVEKKLEMMKNNEIPNIHGMYIHGGVGCGKTMMMDMFFDQIPPNIPKVRKHFHTFMLEIHSKLHAIREESKRSGIQQTDPLITIANEFIEKEGYVLCLDEFQVTDVADAMILKELFSGIFAAGGILISTSNRKPTDLYKNGINRDSFLPFIDILQQRCDIVSMDDMIDYRTLVAKEEGLIHTPLNDNTKAIMTHIYDKLAFGSDSNDITHKNGITLDVAMGRTLHVQHCVPSRVARFDFNELCDKALGAADYLSIAKEFPCLLLENIPILYQEDSMKLRRFITLLDVLYEHRTKMYISAEVQPEFLFQPTIEKKNAHLVQHNQLNKEQLQSNNNMKDNNTTTTGNDLLLAAQNKDEVFASARALSRLTEMMSTTYLSGEFHQQGSKDTKSKVVQM